MTYADMQVRSPELPDQGKQVGPYEPGGNFGLGHRSPETRPTIGRADAVSPDRPPLQALAASNVGSLAPVQVFT